MEAADFRHIDKYEGKQISHPRKSTSMPNSIAEDITTTRLEPQKLENGKWECSHKCKDKAVYVARCCYVFVTSNHYHSCKHLCCREGIDKVRPSRATKPSGTAHDYVNKTHPKLERTVTAALPSMAERLQTKSRAEPKRTAFIQTVDLSSSKYREEYLKNGPKALRDLNKLHGKVSKNTPTPTVTRVKPTSLHGNGGSLPVLFLHKEIDDDTVFKESSDYDDAWMDDLPSPTRLLKEDTDPATYFELNSAGSSAVHGLDWDLELGFNEVDDVHAPISTTVSNALTPSDQDIGQEGERKDQSDYANMISEPLDLPDVLGLVPKREKEERIFLSTDSPEKLPFSLPKPVKRQADELPVVNELSELYVAPWKKRRYSAGDGALVPEASTNKENENLEPQAETTLAPWEDMEGIDMDLLAEFAGIVNFV